jgi:hypothetical protein
MRDLDGSNVPRPSAIPSSTAKSPRSFLFEAVDGTYRGVDGIAISEVWRADARVAPV